MEVFLAVFVLPIMVLNLLGGVVSGIWLLFVGKYSLVIYAFIITMVSTWIISIALMPGLLFIFPIAWASEKKNNILLYIFGTLNLLWTYAVMTIWCTGIFLAIINNHDTGSIWPYLLLGYSLAIGPWGYMASREGPDATGSAIGAFFCSLGGIVLMIVVLFSENVDIYKLIISFGSVMIIALMIQMAILVLGSQRSKVREEDL